VGAGDPVHGAGRGRDRDRRRRVRGVPAVQAQDAVPAGVQHRAAGVAGVRRQRHHPEPGAVADHPGGEQQLQGRRVLLPLRPGRGLPRRRGGPAPRQALQGAAPELRAAAVPGGVGGAAAQPRRDAVHGRRAQGRGGAARPLRQGAHHLEGRRLRLAPLLDPHPLPLPLLLPRQRHRHAHRLPLQVAVVLARHYFLCFAPFVCDDIRHDR
jgi:hypothetical protein